LAVPQSLEEEVRWLRKKAPRSNRDAGGGGTAAVEAGNFTKLGVEALEKRMLANPFK